MNKMEALKHFSPADRLNQVQSVKILKTETIFKDLVGEIYGMTENEEALASIVMDLLAVKHKLVHAITHTKQQTKEREQSHGKEKSDKKDDKKSTLQEIIKEEEF